ncbi:uncharacterized protein LOC131237707 isoform X2 [Magnolia sinica]|uniref:uncharacterized protein LOC131237707 isoform X2 n=1 Tax=Magnolia sinica TaxID=86752 RepID=UPI002659C634|nr:uncharacterized protein LOC131237707 isoform X2 [Magnolia sinica]XP_058091607.1 uncharacterized protein LOC131237707 isoform X2 [Magnolia sinica]
MAGIQCSTEDSDLVHSRAPIAGELISDDDRSIAADSWSVKSDHGSTFDDEQRHVDASDALSTGILRPTSDYGSDKDAPDAEVETSLGSQSYWDATYTNKLTNFHEHGHVGENWFGPEVMEAVVDWTKNLCVSTSQGCTQHLAEDTKSESSGEVHKCLSSWSVLDIGTGSGLILQELAKQGFSDLTGIDSSEAAIDLARNLAVRDGFANIKFLVDDVLETKLERKFQLVVDKGALDAIGLHSDGSPKRVMYWESLSKLVAPGGILVIMSCNSSKDDLVQEMDALSQRRLTPQDLEPPEDQETHVERPPFRYLDCVHEDTTFVFGGAEVSHIETVAFTRI